MREIVAPPRFTPMWMRWTARVMVTFSCSINLWWWLSQPEGDWTNLLIAGVMAAICYQQEKMYYQDNRFLIIWKECEGDPEKILAAIEKEKLFK